MCGSENEIPILLRRGVSSVGEFRSRDITGRMRIARRVRRTRLRTSRAGWKRSVSGALLGGNKTSPEHQAHNVFHGGMISAR